MVGYMKMFVGAAKDRLEALMASPMAPATMHFRTLSLLMMILFNDLMGVQYLCTNYPHLSWTKLLLIFFDTAIIAVDGIKTLLRYGEGTRCSDLLPLSSAAAAAIPLAPPPAALSGCLLSL
jgi:autocrine motility factor receptor